MNRLGATYFWKNFRNHETIEKFSKNFEFFFRKYFEQFFERCNLMGDVILSNTSLIPLKDDGIGVALERDDCEI